MARIVCVGYSGTYTYLIANQFHCNMYSTCNLVDPLLFLKLVEYDLDHFTLLVWVTELIN